MSCDNKFSFAIAAGPGSGGSTSAYRARVPRRRDIVFGDHLSSGTLTQNDAGGDTSDVKNRIVHGSLRPCRQCPCGGTGVKPSESPQTPPLLAFHGMARHSPKALR